jgi:hypothetical protein
MMNSNLVAMIFAIAGLAFAQGPRGPQPNSPPQTGYGLDMSKVQTIEGVVGAVNAGYGMQYPSIQINQVTIKVAPVWFLLEHGFEIKAGDSLKVTAAPSLRASDPYLNAITLVNTVATIALRDANGLPLWTQPQPQGMRHGSGTCSGCGGLTSIGTAAGVVDQVSAGAGIQMPTLVLKTAEGKLLTVKIGPERLLDTADFEIKAGETLTVRYGVTCTNETVALELVNTAGGKLVLRNEDSTPAWN